MTMTIGVTAAVAVVLLIAVIRGYVRGFLKTALSMIALVLPIILVMFLQPYVSAVLRNYTPLESVIASTVFTNMEGQLNTVLSGASASGQESPAAESSGAQMFSREQLAGIVLTEEQQEQWMKLCAVPDLFRTSLQTDMVQTADSFAGSVSNYLAKTILNVLSFLLTFVLAFLLIRLLFVSIDIIGKVPVLHGINKALGAVLGLAEGLVVLWLLFLVLTVCLPSSWGAELMAAVNENPVLAFLYNHGMPLGNLF